MYSLAISKAPSAIPKPWAATPILPPSRVFIAILNPSPSLPTKLLAGTTQSLNRTSETCADLIPHLSSIFPIDIPGKSFSTINADNPLGPFVLSVRAKTINVPDKGAFVMKHLAPFNI